MKKSRKYFEKDTTFDFTEAELELAFKLWQVYRKPAFRDLDVQLQPFLQIECDNQNWLKQAREALELPATTIASNLGMTRSAYYQMEENEAKGSISLATLRKIAEAMDCELVYAIRPKTKLTFSQTIWQKVLSAAKAEIKKRSYPKAARPRVLFAVTQELLQLPRMRKKLGLTERIPNRILI